MTTDAPRSSEKEVRRKASVLEWCGYGVVAITVWLGWEVVKQPLISRGPPEIAVRLAPSSPEVLRRAAEGELAAKRYENARVLAEQSLMLAPFNARALRVEGLAVAAEGRVDEADQMLTLAGNWSLRDDPTHAWLVERRLRRGDYNSAFAHADTLVRRRTDLAPQVFALFTTAMLSDPKASPSIIRLVAAAPPWRQAYLTYLHESVDGDPILLTLALGLERTPHPLDKIELGRLYQVWAREGRLNAINLVRATTNRPPVTSLLQDTRFDDPPGEQPSPFAWRLGVGAGFDVQVTQDDLRPDNNALRADYDGYHSGVIAEQLVMLKPGRYRLSGDQRFEVRPDNPRTRWTITCLEDGKTLPPAGGNSASSGDAWARFGVEWQIPASGCSAQWLRLDTIPNEDRATVIVWYDNLTLRPSARTAEGPADPSA